jgi:hypothetical protein
MIPTVATMTVMIVEEANAFPLIQLIQLIRGGI